jgi:hypothetical protein
VNLEKLLHSIALAKEGFSGLLECESKLSEYGWLAQLVRVLR